MKFIRIFSLVLALCLLLGLAPIPVRAASELVDLGAWSKVEGKDLFRLTETDTIDDGLFQTYRVACDSIWDTLDEADAYLDYLVEEYGYKKESGGANWNKKLGFFGWRWLSGGSDTFDFQDKDSDLDLEDAQVLILVQKDDSGDYVAFTMYGNDILSGGSGRDSGGLKFMDPAAWDEDLFIPVDEPENCGSYYRQSYYTDIESLASIQEVLQDYTVDMDMVWSGSNKGDKEGYFWLTDTKHNYDTFSYAPERVNIEIEDCHLIVGYRYLARDTWDVFCMYSKDLVDHIPSIKDTEKKTEKNPTITIETEPAAPPTPKASGKLPDLQAFSNDKLYVNSTYEYDSYTQIVYLAKSPEKARKMFKEYADLLQEKYDLSIRKANEKGGDYSFDYTGSATVSTFDCDKLKNSNDVSVFIRSFNGREFHIWYANGFDYTDTGDRTTQELTKYEKKTSGGGSSSGTPCGSCTNGDCSTCRGTGHIRGFAKTGQALSDCPNCANGDCSRCGGDGVIS